MRNSFCGTPIFIAPEIYKNDVNHEQFSYSYKNDIWALGVIFYTLLTGKNPFNIHAKGNEKHLKSLIMNSTYMIPSSQNSSGSVISEEARDLL